MSEQSKQPRYGWFESYPTRYSDYEAWVFLAHIGIWGVWQLAEKKFHELLRRHGRAVGMPEGRASHVLDGRRFAVARQTAEALEKTGPHYGRRDTFSRLANSSAQGECGKILGALDQVVVGREAD